MTPDPPLPPGQQDIPVPDIVPVRAPDGPDAVADSRDAAHSAPTPERDAPV